MRVLIDDGMRIRLGTGIGQYCKYLHQSLQGKISVDLHQYNPSVHNRKLGRLMYLLHINSPAFIKKCSGYDCVHFAGQFLPRLRSRKTKYIATVHDLVAFIHPETMTSLTSFLSRRKISRIMRDADAVFTVSESVKNDMQKYFPEYMDKVRPIHPGHYSEIQFTEDCKYDHTDLKGMAGSPFFLFVGTIEKRKNVGMIIDAFFKLKEESDESRDYKLVLAGRRGYGYEEFQEKVHKSNYRDDVIFTGYVSKEDCNRLYSHAKAYVFPTVYEGFGSTQLECMACHTPLILSDIPTNQEVSNEYGLFFDLDDIDSLVGQMKEIVIDNYDHDRRNKIADKIMESFSWQKLADTYIEQYKEAIGV